MKIPAKIALGHQLCDTEDDDHQGKAKLLKYFQTINFQLSSNVMCDRIAETEAKITNFKKPESLPALRGSEVLR